MKTKFLLVSLFAASISFAQTAIKNESNPNDDISSELVQDKLLTLDIPDYGLAGNYSITGLLNNKLAGTVTNATIQYVVDKGAVISEQIAMNADRSAEVTSFKSQTAVYLSVGNHLVKAWVSEINGQTLANPEVVTTEVHIASRAATRHGLIEEFTSSTCGPCAQENAKLDPLLLSYNPNSGGDYNVIKYQMNWPDPGNDPSYNQHGYKRRMYYDSKAGIPFGYVNGKKTTYDTKAGIEGSKATPATVDISAYLLVSGSDLTCKATITPYVTATVTVHQVVLQDYYTFNGTNGQTKYYWVMRKMNPDGSGAQNTSITDGKPFDVTFNHKAVQVAKPAQNSFDFWTISSLKYQYVVFVQDETSKAVLNSASGLATTVGIVDIKNDAQIGVYPNPAEGFAIIGIKVQKETKVSLNIYDVSGKVVYTNESPLVNIGQNEININTSNFAPGVYTIVVNTNNGILRDKLVVN